MSQKNRQKRLDKRQAAAGGHQLDVRTTSATPTTRNANVEYALTHQSLHIGPLPDPETLRSYDDILPGAAQRVVAMAEKEQSHRHTMEVRDDRQISRGRRAALLVALAFLVGSVWLIYIGRGVEGTILGTTDVVALVTVFILGNKNERG